MENCEAQGVSLSSFRVYTFHFLWNPTSMINSIGFRTDTIIKNRRTRSS